jgi:hypothetical protein
MHIHDIRSTHAIFGDFFHLVKSPEATLSRPWLRGGVRGLMGFSVVFTMGKTMGPWLLIGGTPWENHGKI